MKRFLQKTLFRLQTLLLLTVMFVVGGSAWAYDFQPDKTSFNAIGTLDGTYSVTSQLASSAGLPIVYFGDPFKVVDEHDVEVGNVTARVGATNATNKTAYFEVSNSSASSNGVYRIVVNDGAFCAASYNYLDLTGFTITISLTGMTPATPVDWTVQTTPTNVGGITDGTDTKTNGEAFSITGSPVQANYSAIDAAGYNKGQVQFDENNHTISVVYTAQITYTYTINVTGTDDANAGVTYNGTLYKNTNSFTTTDLLLTEDDFTVATVFQKKGEVTVGTPDQSHNVAVNVAYTTEYRYKVTSIDSYGMLAYVKAGSEFWVKDVIKTSTTRYDASSLQGTQLAGYSPVITVTSSLDPTYDYAIELTYTPRTEYGEPYDLYYVQDEIPSISPAPGSVNQDPFGSITIKAPQGCHFDLNEGTGGANNSKNVAVTVNGEIHYGCTATATDGTNTVVTLTFKKTIQEEGLSYTENFNLNRGANTVVIGEGQLNLLNADGTMTKNSAKNLAYNVKYKYSVRYATNSAYPSAKGKVTYNGQNVVLDYSYSTGTIYSESILTNADLANTSVEGYNVAVNIINPNVETGVDGFIELNYTLVPTHVDVTSQFNQNNAAGTQVSISGDVLGFGEYTVTRKDYNKNAYILNESGINVTKPYGATEGTFSFNPAITGAGEHTLVIPAGMYKYNGNDELINEEIRITYNLAASYKYNFSFVDTSNNYVAGGGVTIGGEDYSSYHGYFRLFNAALSEENIEVIEVPGYTSEIVFTQPDGESDGLVKVVYTLNVTELSYTQDVTGNVYSLTSDVLHFDGAVTKLKNPTFNGGNATVTANGNDLNITFPANLGAGTYTLTFANAALKVGDDYNQAFTVTYTVTEKPMMYDGAYIGEANVNVDASERTATVESFQNIRIYFDEAMAYSYDTNDLSGFTFTKDGEPFAYSYGWANEDGSDFYFYFNGDQKTPGTYVAHFDQGTFYSKDGHSSEEITFTITIPEPTYFAAMTVSPATGAEVESLKTFTLTAPEGVTFDKVKGLQNSGRVTFDGNVYTYTNNVVWAEDNKSVSFDISEVTTDGAHTLVIPAGFLRSTDGEWSPEFTATYTVSYPWFTLYSYQVQPNAGEVDAINGITIAAPSEVEFDEPEANVVIKVNGEDTTVGASLDGEGNIVLDYTATAANRYEINIPAETFTAAEGFKKNKALSLTYIIQPTLAINEHAVDNEGNYWTSFCLNKSFTLEDGYTPYIVCEKAEGGIELVEVEGTPKTTYYEAYTRDGSAYFDNNRIKDAAIDDFITITLGGSYSGTSNYRTMAEDSYVDVVVTDDQYELIDVESRSWSPTQWASSIKSKTEIEGGFRIVYDGGNDSFLGGLQLTYAKKGEINKPVIPANAGILVKGEAKSGITYTETYSTPANLTGNLLVGCTQTATWNDADNYIYKLAWNKENFDNGTYTDFGFYWGSNDGHSMDALAGKAYLKLPATSGSSNRMLIFGGSDEVVTAIDSVVEVSDDAPIFTLQGKRVSRENLPAGVYVKNGRKFIVK